MPITLNALCAQISPTNTALLLGAGASVPSGAPSGASLAARLWREIAKTEPQSEDLIETTSILERRFSRRPVIDCVISSLRSLKPTGGLLGLPRLGWREIFSTNFDQLIENSYKASNLALTAIRSNFDYTNRESRQGTTLYKIHGCITQDRALGDKASMILTEEDYEQHEQYRQTSFSLLQNAMLTGDILILGQSLRDKHLADLVKRVLSLKPQGVSSNVYVLVYDQDDLRAPLLEDRGARVAFGGIDDFVHAMGQLATSSPVAITPTPDVLPMSLVSIVEDVMHAKSREPNVVRMFNGAPATYADISAGATFERALSAPIKEQLEDKSIITITLVGAGGVGKTTLARQLLISSVDAGILAFEHKSDFPFLSQPWITLEATLRANEKKAILFLDECTRYLRQVNILVEHLADLPFPALKIVLTANAAQWTQRLKSPILFTRGRVHEMSRLVDQEMHSLVNLLQFNRTIAELVQADFRNVGRAVQLARLKERCSADMFVCLKNIFANESLDNILLYEYEDLPPATQEHYRYIAALEAVGLRVHRQLAVRLLGLQADQIASVLQGLKGIIDEYEINAREGIYGWSTRHLVIARKITEYKFSSLDELSALFKKIIKSINPGVRTELQSIRDLCDAEFGIGRLGDSETRQRLYRDLIGIAPGERIPWHRLIRELLDQDRLEEVEYLIRDAIDAVGQDAPLDRFKVRLLMARAELTKGIALGDRVAILRRAYELASSNIERHRADKHSYRVLCQVAVKLLERGESVMLLQEAISKLRNAAAEILDPDMDRDIRRYEDIVARA